MIGDTPVDTEEKSSQEYPTTKSGKTSYVTIYNNIADKDNYDCTDTEDSLGYYTVINRRIGVVNYIITKNGMTVCPRKK